MKRGITLVCKRLIQVFGVMALLLLLLSFTPLPYYAYYYLGTSGTELNRPPDLIVVLGGAGMPSPDGLIRTYYAANAGNEFKNAAIVIALPYNENDKDSLMQIHLMAHELIVKGIDSVRIHYEPLGFNTRSQALNILSMYLTTKDTQALLIVTSPEHMYRSVKTFRKAGFTQVGGLPTFEKPVDEERAKDKENAKDRRVKSLMLRYNMWSYLNYELLVLREYSAISYYKMKGWI